MEWTNSELAQMAQRGRITTLRHVKVGRTL